MGHFQFNLVYFMCCMEITFVFLGEGITGL